MTPGEGVLEAAEKEIGGVSSKGLLLARELAPTAIDVISGNPHTLAEWCIYLALLPITLPLSFGIWAARWIMVEAPLLVNQIKKITGLERTGPLGEFLAGCVHIEGPLGGIIQALTNPSNEFDLGIMETAAGGAASESLGAVLEPIVRPIGYCANRMFQDRFIDSSVAAQLVHKGFLDNGSALSIMENFGYGSDQGQLLIDQEIAPPDLMSIITMLNRGFIDSGTAYQWLRQTGTDDQFCGPLLDLRNYVPGPGEIAGFMASYAYSSDLRGEFDLDAEFPTNSMADAARNGVSEDEARKMWLGHWTTPNVAQAADMMHRGIIGRDEALAIARLSGLPTVLREPLLNAQEQLITQRYIRNLRKYGIMSHDEVTAAYLKIGFSAANAAKMSTLADVMINPITQTEIADTFKTGYSDGLLDYNTALQSLEKAGHSEYESKLLLAIAEYSKGGDILKTVEQYAKTAFMNGDKTLDESINYLDQYGEKSERKTVLRELWQEEYNHTIKHVSEGDARSAYTKGLINASQLRAFLEMLRYTEDDISVIIALENATMTAPQDSVLAPITTNSGKAKSFTKAELKNMYIDGIITAEEWFYNMASLGYTNAQINAYAQLLVDTANKSKKATTSAS